MWYTTIFWKRFVYLSENDYGIEYISFNLAIIINAILECSQSRKHYEAIMDDLLLFTPSKEDLLKALLKNGLKISPKKCQLFKTELQYMGTSYL